MNLDFDIRGYDDVLNLRVRAAGGIRDEIEDILSAASALALAEMRRNVPRGNLTYGRNTGGQGAGGEAKKNAQHRTIYSSLGRGPIVYRPGAAGGGGYYEIDVGAVNNPPEHLEWVMEGTDNYPGQGNVFRVMAIQKLGERVKFRMSRSGQKPQRAWFDNAYRQANAFIYNRIRSLDLFEGNQ